ncbi:hypothetical protein [Streptomyces jumonjinensis]|uniref:Uncharacterized protein n=1 Tax=Streptomyces jumonjinensis TaxID=1945 RepID=A0A646KI20_STRJU|nr:hypothetical protein [Streptomyces jumonjinensis]MQT01912.1 hypothetical protein [Streptomyces jumonjinensis]
MAQVTGRPAAWNGIVEARWPHADDGARRSAIYCPSDIGSCDVDGGRRLFRRPMTPIGVAATTTAALVDPGRPARIASPVPLTGVDALRHAVHRIVMESMDRG